MQDDEAEAQARDPDQELADLLGEAWNCEVAKQPVEVEINYAMLRASRPVAILEAQAADWMDWAAIAQQGYRISADKVSAASRWCGLLGVAFVLAVRAGGEVRFTVCRTPRECVGLADSWIWATPAEVHLTGQQSAHAVIDAKRFRTLP